MRYLLVSGGLILFVISRLFLKKDRKAIQTQTPNYKPSLFSNQSSKLSLDEIFSWIQQREGQGRSVAVKDGIGKNGEQLYSIGWGHQIQPNEKDLLTRSINIYEMNDLFIRDAEKIIDDMNKNIKVPINKNQQLALFSLRYNIGPSAFNNSTLLKLLNQGNYTGAAGRFAEWRLSEGKINQGLVNRRELERQLFLKPI